MGISFWLRPEVVERFAEAEPIAQALVEREAESWPPVAEDLAGALERSQSQVEPPADSGAPPADAGPPLPEPPPDEPDFRVRRGHRLDLHYLEVVAGEAGWDDPLPMIVVLHGRGGTAQIPGGPFRELAHAVRIVVPQAPDPLGSGYAWMPVRVGQGLVDRLSSTLFLAASRVANLVRALVADRPTIGRPIVTGFSQGAMLVLALALYHDDIVGTALPIAGWLPPPLEPAYRRSDLEFPVIRAMHGTADPTVPIDPTRLLFERLQELGFDVELFEIEGVGHSATPAMDEVVHFWLDAGVCRALGDSACEAAAEREARVQLGLEPADGGVPPDAGSRDAGIADGSIDAGTDAGRDAGRRRARRRDAGPDAGHATTAPVL